MKIAIDIDAVLGDFLTKFLEFRNDKFKTNYKREDFFTYEWDKVFKESREIMNNIIYDFFESNYFKKIKPMPGAVSGIFSLRHDHQLSLITSRPRLIKEETLRWLENYFPKTFQKVYFSNQPAFNSFGRSKGEICNDIEAEIFIDDQYGFCLECVDNDTKVFLYDSPWNQEVKIPDGMKRVHSWPEIINNLSKI